MTPPRVDQDRPANLSLLPQSPGTSPDGPLSDRPGALELTRLQEHINAAKDWIDDAHDALTPDEYAVWADIVGRALTDQRPAA